MARHQSRKLGRFGASRFDSCLFRHLGPVAQPAEAAASKAVQSQFESERAHHCRRSPTGRGSRLRACTVRVRIAPAAPSCARRPTGRVTTLRTWAVQVRILPSAPFTATYTDRDSGAAVTRAAASAGDRSTRSVATTHGRLSERQRARPLPGGRVERRERVRLAHLPPICTFSHGMLQSMCCEIDLLSRQAARHVAAQSDIRDSARSRSR